MDEISSKPNDIDKIYKKNNETKYFSRRLNNGEHKLNVWGENHDDLKDHVASLENGYKELNSHIFYSHHSFFQPPNIHLIFHPLTNLCTR